MKASHKALYPWVRPFVLPSLDDASKAIAAKAKASSDRAADLYGGWLDELLNGPKQAP